MNLSQDNTVHLIMAAVAVGWLVIQLFTNGKIAAVVNAITKTNGLIEAHTASDTQKHAAIDAHLSATDGRVSRLEDKVY